MSAPLFRVFFLGAFAFFLSETTIGVAQTPQRTIAGIQTLEFLSADGITRLNLDVYPPHLSDPHATAPPNPPLVVFLHGGGFFAGSRNQPVNQDFCESLSQFGICVASMDYRLLQQGRGFHCDISIEEKRTAISAASSDLNSAIQALQQYHRGALIIAGSSAGAHAVLHAAYFAGLKNVNGVISICGAMEPGCNFPEIPLLSFHGTCDALVPFGEAEHHFCAKNTPGAMVLQGGGALAKCLPNVELHSYLNAGHDLSSSVLGDPTSIESCANFVRRIQAGGNTTGTYLYEGKSTCKLNAPYLPCQH